MNTVLAIQSVIQGPVLLTRLKTTQHKGTAFIVY